MKIDEAYNNLSQVLLFGRIEMPNGALTGQEHSELQGNLRLLFDEAKENQESKQNKKEIDNG
ncbi:MAG: hypothetical protein GWN67_20515 [Phycisphaerae bacterium]|nr:hypothetical protein [Fodinibius sp.]NIU58679.1 hypothetical protein [Phycisphaerae bacterium]NIV16168.1 hypothetical protein [Fodinibius sp.]NIW94965.1 hypothetical protein [Phycisphaerae bacterium]NIY30149.1 hypothetical protein [Fodinibius sp.]